MSDQTKPVNSSFQLWKQHNTGTRINTDLFITEALRESHPGYHVTRTGTSACALLPYAKAGFATAIPDREEGYDAVRGFKSPRRLEKSAGKLEDSTTFGRWLYTWNEKEFIVYFIGYMDSFRHITHYYVLSSHSEALVTNGHHTDTDALLLACCDWTKELHEEIEIFDDARWQKSKTLYESVKGTSWKDVILEPTMKDNLIRDVQEFFDNREIYQSLKVPWKRGVILHGIPGNGKTISVKALINSLAARPEPVPSLYVKSLDSCNGAKWSINSIFSHARKMSPCLLIFEDLDSMVEDKVRSYFLNEVDGLESNEGILMIGSTNHLNKLDSAITKRPSRFDRKYHFKLPREVERITYCRYWSQKFAGSSSVDFPDELCLYIASITEGFSFAYLKELFISSLLTLARGGNLAMDNAEDEAILTDAESSGGSSEAVMVEGADSVAKDKEGDNPTEPTKKEEKKDATILPKPKRVLPQVEVPETLRDNLLLQIIVAHTKALLNEMDNSSEAETSQSPAPTPIRRTMRATAVAVPAGVFDD